MINMNHFSNSSNIVERNIPCTKAEIKNVIDPFLHESERVVEQSWSGEYWKSMPKQRVPKSNEELGKLRVSIHPTIVNREIDSKEDYYVYTYNLGPMSDYIPDIRIEGENVKDIHAVEYSIQSVPVTCIPFIEGYFNFFKIPLSTKEVHYCNHQVCIYSKIDLQNTPTITTREQLERKLSNVTSSVWQVLDQNNRSVLFIIQQGQVVAQTQNCDPKYRKVGEIPKSLSLIIDSVDVNLSPIELIEKYKST